MLPSTCFNGFEIQGNYKRRPLKILLLIWYALCKLHFCSVLLILSHFLMVFMVPHLTLYRVIPHPSPGAIQRRLKVAAAHPCPSGGLAKTLPLCSVGRKSLRAHRCIPARGPCCQTTWWMPERYTKPVIDFLILNRILMYNLIKKIFLPNVFSFTFFQIILFPCNLPPKA